MKGLMDLVNILQICQVHSYLHKTIGSQTVTIRYCCCSSIMFLAIKLGLRNHRLTKKEHKSYVSQGKSDIKLKT